MQTIYLSVVLASPTMMIVKLTFFLLYLNIFRPNNTMRFYIYIGAFSTTIFYMGIGIAQFIFLTPPPGMTWMEYIPSPRAKKITILSIPSAAVGLGIDLYILILPIGGVMRLQLPTRRKLGVCLIFITGILCVILSTYPINSIYLTDY